MLSQKIANIVSVYKKGEKEHAENYWPMSLLSIVSNVLERCVLNNVCSQLYQVITASQHGFTRGRSCVTNLLEVTNHISSVLDVGDQVDAVYLDMSNRSGSRPWRTWLEPRSDFFHLRIFCINLFEDIMLNISRYTYEFGELYVVSFKAQQIKVYTQ